MRDLAAPVRARRASFGDLSGHRPIVVLAPHPDDESLGCGALLATAFAGPGAHVVCMTDGSASHPGSGIWPAERLAERRADELALAVKTLGGGVDDVTWLGLPDTRMLEIEPRYPEIAERIAAIVRRLGARALFAPAETDPHCDHVGTARIARLVVARTGVRLLSYPIWSRWADPHFRDRLGYETEHGFDASACRTPKNGAIAAHRSQHGELVTDDPDGFVLPEGFLSLFRTGDEIFFERTAD